MKISCKRFEPMLRYLPKECQLGIYVCHKPGNGKMRGCSGIIGTYLRFCCRYIGYIDRYRRHMSFLCQTIALEMDMQQCREEQCGKKRIHPFLMFGYDRDTVHCPF